MNVQLITEVSVKLPDETGLLAKVTSALLGAGVNIMAMVAWTEGDTASFQIATTQADTAASALMTLTPEVTTRSAVAVELPNRPGAIDLAARRLAENGIYINHVYGSTTKTSAPIIYQTEDDEKAYAILRDTSDSLDVIL